MDISNVRDDSNSLLVTSGIFSNNSLPIVISNFNGQLFILVYFARIALDI